MIGYPAGIIDKQRYLNALPVFIKPFKTPTVFHKGANTVYFAARGMVQGLTVRTYSGSTPTDFFPRITIETCRDWTRYCVSVGLDKKVIKQRMGIRKENVFYWRCELTVLPKELETFLSWLGTWFSSEDGVSPPLPLPASRNCNNAWPMQLTDNFHFYEWSAAAEKAMNIVERNRR